MMSKKKENSTFVELYQNVGEVPMLCVLICDDNEDMLRKLKMETENIFSTLDIKPNVHIYKDAAQISDQMLSICDIALLDIDLENSKYSGMDVARRLRSVREDAIIIFVTNFIEYAPEGYEVQAFRYVLKRELDTELTEYILQAVEQLRSLKELYKIQVKGEVIDLPIKDILYLEVQQHNVTVYVQNDLSAKHIKAYSFYASLSEIEKQLEPLGFLRIHKSFLVNMRHLRKLQCREALLYNGTVLRVGEKHYNETKKKYLLWRGWR